MIYISCVEECILNPEYQDYIGGRIEVHRPEDMGYHSEEIRFLTKDIDGFNAFRNVWDMSDITNNELKYIKDVVSELWCDNV